MGRARIGSFSSDYGDFRKRMATEPMRQSEYQSAENELNPLNRPETGPEIRRLRRFTQIKEAFDCGFGLLSTVRDKFRKSFICACAGRWLGRLAIANFLDALGEGFSLFFPVWKRFPPSIINPNPLWQKRASRLKRAPFCSCSVLFLLLRCFGRGGGTSR